MKKIKLFSILIITIILNSCTNSNDDSLVTIPSNSKLLISKLNYHSIESDSIVFFSDYTYNSTYNLIKKESYNLNTPLASITKTYEYENGRVIKCNVSHVTNYSNTPNTENYHYLYTYNENSLLITVQRFRPSSSNVPLTTHFEYNENGKIIKSFFDNIDIDICDEYPENNPLGIDPILRMEYVYDSNGNVELTNQIQCYNDIQINMTFDNKKRPSDGLDYIPRTDLLTPISQYSLYSQSLSNGNVLETHTLMDYEYEYNALGYPTIITPIYDGHELPSYEIEYISTD